MTRTFGLGRGKVFPAANAGSLLNPLRRLIQSPNRTVARMDLKSTDNVLEIGCGPGYFSSAIARSVPSGSLVLFDLQNEMLELARERLGDFPNVRFTQGDALSLPFPDASFDAILLVLVLGEVPDKNRCVSEVSRVLRQGGSVTFAESRRDSDFIPFAELRTYAENNGLEMVEKCGLSCEYTARFRRNCCVGRFVNAFTSTVLSVVSKNSADRERERAATTGPSSTASSSPDRGRSAQR